MSARTIRLLLERFVDEDHPNAPADLPEMVRVGLATLAGLLRENNALRRNNERLTRENAALLKRACEAESSARTAQTMAAHWRTEARGGNYDETKENAP